MDLSGTTFAKISDKVPENEVLFLREKLKEKIFLVKSLVTAHVGLCEASLNKNYEEIKSTAESYNQIPKKKKKKKKY